MRKNITKFLLLVIAFTFALSINYIFAAWTGPIQAPPGGNTPTPVHIGTTNQVKDGGLGLNALSVFGNGYFQDNVGIGIVSPQAKLDVAGKIKVGDDSVSPTAGTIRWSGSDFEGYDGSAWKSLTVSGGGGGGGAKTQADCVATGGSWSGDQGVCYFAGSTCPVGWNPQANYSSTQEGFCRGKGCSSDYSCRTKSHYRQNQGQEGCSYRSGGTRLKTRIDSDGYPVYKCVGPGMYTCTAGLSEVGCL